MKKLLSFSLIACSVILLAGCGSKKADVSDVTTTGNIAVPAVTTTNGKKVDATKAQCLEMVTFGMNLAIAQSKGDKLNIEKLTQEAATLEKKFNTENVEYETACNKYMTDADFIKEIQKLTTQSK
ncbi:MAG: hypothetical protein NT085_03215 [candidate division SR1 bacterium]|nr:hypothetical protein [candidate division SR1 bacterium]